MEISKEKIAEIGGYAGMALIHGATLPQMVNILIDPSAQLAPLSMVLMVWIGLVLFFVRSIVRWDWLYVVSNGIGLFFNSILMILIVWGKID